MFRLFLQKNPLEEIAETHLPNELHQVLKRINLIKSASMNFKSSAGGIHLKMMLTDGDDIGTMSFLEPFFVLSIVTSNYQEAQANVYFFSNGKLIANVLKDQTNRLIEKLVDDQQRSWALAQYAASIEYLSEDQGAECLQSLYERFTKLFPHSSQELLAKSGPTCT